MMDCYIICYYELFFVTFYVHFGIVKTKKIKKNI